ncbi:unnamed protein product [Ceratitis capitata]|uniref:(Mediterranean fruit fly) hypothetical protein n=1 Tax=Ceratitis capitata TaxID=7213 RepID=A0A811UPQ6_CERCA|nr:unnamed protein product [Ceratitis capitata]
MSLIHFTTPEYYALMYDIEKVQQKLWEGDTHLHVNAPTQKSVVKQLTHKLFAPKAHCLVHSFSFSISNGVITSFNAIGTVLDCLPIRLCSNASAHFKDNSKE